MNQADSLGKLVLRVALGLLVLLHGISKLSGGVGFVAQVVQAAGLPAFFAYGVYIGEIVAPLMLIAGFYARIGAVIVAINMLVAIALVHTSELFTLGATGGWALELQGMFLFGALAVALMGPGRFAINAK